MDTTLPRGDRRGDARRFHAYCLGPPRSGTHSVARMLASHFVSRHEPARVETLERLLRWLAGEYTDGEMRRMLTARDEFLCLEMEAAHYLHHAVEMLVDLHPDAIFVLTVRDPYTWLDSEINQNIITQRFPLWRQLEAQRYGRYGYQYEEEERTLAALDNVYPVASYLSYWTDHYRRVLDAVPVERLLIVRTADLPGSAATLAAALRIDPMLIDTAAGHAAHNEARACDLFASLSPGYLAHKVREHCAPEVVGRVLPEGIPDVARLTARLPLPTRDACLEQ